MRRLIDSVVDWVGITNGRIAKEEYRFELGQGVMHKETGILVVPMTLNFVLPYDELLKLKALVKSKLDFIEDVKFRFSFRDMVMNEEEIVRHYLPYLIQILEGNGSGFAKAIDSGFFEIREGEHRTLVLHCFGKTCEEQLNETVSSQFERILLRNFGMRLKVLFENDHEEYQEKAEVFADDIREELVQIIEENNQKAQEAEARPAEDRTDNGSGAANGGNGFANNGNFRGNWRSKKEAPIKDNFIMGRGFTGEPDHDLMGLEPPWELSSWKASFSRWSPG